MLHVGRTLGHSRKSPVDATATQANSKRQKPRLSSASTCSDSTFSIEGSQSTTFGSSAWRSDGSRSSSAKKPGSKRNSVVRGESSRRNAHPIGKTTSEVSEDSFSHIQQNPITVTIRVRPALKHEAGMEDIITCAHDGMTLLLENAERSKQVTVDAVIDSRGNQGSQQYFYDRIGKSLVISALKDYNVCIFAYGHTGSGKTYTMLGNGGVDGPHVGLLPRFIRELFQEHTSPPSMRDAHYSCQYYEVYNETIRDLLAPIHVHGQDRRRDVRVHPKYGVRIEGLSTSVVKDTEETLNLVLFGNQMRAIAATTMNAQSSRSHCIFTFRYVSETEKEHHESVMTFVDLAGREDQGASQNKEVQFREMTYINTSLFHLSHLITKLSDGSVRRGKLADFRNSKLTLLLSHALVGNSCTVLLATIAPASAYFEDSLSTLNFAQQVKKIKTKPIINTKKTSAVVHELESEIQKLRKELSIAKFSNSETEQSLAAAQALITHYTSGREHDKASSADAYQMRRRLSSTLGLQITDTACNVPKAASGEPLPFLTKLSDDSSLQGCCNYFLVKERTCVGLRHGCDIVLRGVGIRPSMCVIVVKSDNTIMVELGQGTLEAQEVYGLDTVASGCARHYSEADEPRVLVKGVNLTSILGACALEHGDAIIFGYSHAFRLVVPSSLDASMDAASMARQKLEKLDLASAMEEVQEEGSHQYQQIYQFLLQMNAECSEKTVHALLKALNVICPLIDEANAITREVLGIGSLKFKIHMATDLISSMSNYPQVVVGVFANAEAPSQGFHEISFQDRARTLSCSLVPTVRSPLVSSLGLAPRATVSEDQLLYVWTLEKFMRRLNEMREVYQAGAAAHDQFAAVREQFRGDPFLNPWREATFADTKMLSENARYSMKNVSAPDASRSTSPKSQQNPDRHKRIFQPYREKSPERVDTPHSNSDEFHSHCASRHAAGITNGTAMKSENFLIGNSSDASLSSGVSSPEMCFRNFLDVRKRLMELEASARCPIDVTCDVSMLLEKLDGMFDRISSPPTFRRPSPVRRKALSRESSPSQAQCEPVKVSSALRDNIVAQRFQQRSLELLRNL